MPKDSKESLRVSSNSDRLGLAEQLERTLTDLRLTLGEQGKSHFAKYLDNASERNLWFDPIKDELPSVGALVRIEECDTTLQVHTGDQGYVTHSATDGHTWAVVRNRAYDLIVGEIRRAQLRYGFEPCLVWDVVASAVGTTKASALGMHASQEGTIPVLSLRAVAVADQFCVLLHPKAGPQIPGMADTDEVLKELHAQVPRGVVNTPEALFESLLTALALHHFERFSELWVTPPDQRALERRFEQLSRSFFESGGQIAFEGFAQNRGPADYKPGGMVKMFVRRTDGQHQPKPLSLIKADSGWLIKTGSF